jgi:hypothetical protein
LCLAGACAQAVPDALLNPDVTPATQGQTICSSGYTKTVRPSTSFTNGIKKRLFREQGMDFDADIKAATNWITSFPSPWAAIHAICIT